MTYYVKRNGAPARDAAPNQFRTVAEAAGWIRAQLVRGAVTPW